MNEFIKSLKEDKRKEIDGTIKKHIQEIIKNVENKNDTYQYKKAIMDRNKGIEEIFENFDANMEIIEYTNYFISSKEQRYETIIDNYLAKRIKSQQEIIFNKIAQNIKEDDSLVLEKAETQVADRIDRITKMLRHYKQNMQIIRNHKDNKPIINLYEKDNIDRYSK